MLGQGGERFCYGTGRKTMGVASEPGPLSGCSFPSQRGGRMLRLRRGLVVSCVVGVEVDLGGHRGRLHGLVLCLLGPHHAHPVGKLFKPVRTMTGFRTHSPTPARRWEAEDRLRRAAPAGAAARHHSLTRRRLALGNALSFLSAACACICFLLELRTHMCAMSLYVAMATFPVVRCAARRACARPRHARIWACIRCVLVICRLWGCC